jgi:hypothetical protein
MISIITCPDLHKQHEGKKSPSPAPSVLPAQALERKIEAAQALEKKTAAETSFAKIVVKTFNKKKVDTTTKPEHYSNNVSVDDEYEG